MPASRLPLLEAVAWLEYASFRNALGDVDEPLAYEQPARRLYGRSGASATP